MTYAMMAKATKLMPLMRFSLTRGQRDQRLPCFDDIRPVAAAVRRRRRHRARRDTFTDLLCGCRCQSGRCPFDKRCDAGWMRHIDRMTSRGLDNGGTRPLGHETL